MFRLEGRVYPMAPRPSLRGTTLKRAIYPPDGTTTFDLAMGVLKTLQSDYGAVVTEVDVSPEGMRFDLKLPAELPSLRLAARHRMLHRLPGEGAPLAGSDDEPNGVIPRIDVVQESVGREAT